jgi:hypothetical protein
VHLEGETLTSGRWEEILGELGPKFSFFMFLGQQSPPRLTRIKEATSVDMCPSMPMANLDHRDHESHETWSHDQLCRRPGHRHTCRDIKQTVTLLLFFADGSCLSKATGSARHRWICRLYMVVADRIIAEGPMPRAKWPYANGSRHWHRSCSM